MTSLSTGICIELYLILQDQVNRKDHLATMNKCLLVINCFLCAEITIHAQQITDSGLPVVGILGSLGISGINSELISSIGIQRNVERSRICLQSGVRTIQKNARKN